MQKLKPTIPNIAKSDSQQGYELELKYFYGIQTKQNSLLWEIVILHSKNRLNVLILHRYPLIEIFCATFFTRISTFKIYNHIKIAHICFLAYKLFHLVTCTLSHLSKVTDLRLIAILLPHGWLYCFFTKKVTEIFPC